MPSAGLPIESILDRVVGTNKRTRGQIKKFHEDVNYIENCAKTAMKAGLFLEWLESFIGAWNKTKDPIQSAIAGLIEWDIT